MTFMTPADLGTQSVAPAPSYEVLVQQAAQLGQRLVQGNWTISTVESCTGGLIATALTEVAGSSAWFERGFVTYSNDAKTGSVGVPAALIAAHGAVSEPVAAAMAQGALQVGSARIAVSVTGVAGPSGGSPEKPVGTVCFGWALRPDGASVAGRSSSPIVHTVTCRFAGDRAEIRLRSARHALHGVALLIGMDAIGTDAIGIDDAAPA